MGAERRNGDLRREVLRVVMQGGVSQDHAKPLVEGIEKEWRAEGELQEGQPLDIEIVRRENSGQ